MLYPDIVDQWMYHTVHIDLSESSLEKHKSKDYKKASSAALSQLCYSALSEACCKQTGWAMQQSFPQILGNGTESLMCGRVLLRDRGRTTPARKYVFTKLGLTKREGCELNKMSSNKRAREILTFQCWWFNESHVKDSALNQVVAGERWTGPTCWDFNKIVAK